MAWIESHQALGHHPKTLRLASALKCSVPAAVGHLHFLWWWAVDYAPDGLVHVGDIPTVAKACEWRGNPERFWLALTAAGFVEDAGIGVWKIHDWMDYAGRLVQKRAANAERMRNARAAHVQHTFDARAGATVPTVPDQPYLPDQQTNPPNPPLHQASGGDGAEICPECELLVSREGEGHGLSKLPGRIRNCSLDHRKPYEWPVANGVDA